MVDQHLDSIKLTRNHYPSVKDVTWDDVMDKASSELSVPPFTGIVIWNDYEIHSSVNPHEKVKLRKTIHRQFTNPPTFVLHSDYRPGTLNQIFQEVSAKQGLKVMHVYFSFGRDNLTFGDHKDTVDVLILQAKGTMSYICEGITYKLNVGDSLFIPKGTYHEPVVTGPRITLSFSWE
jgi:ribosomal protein L16 Arg81 hydroxylase